MKMGDKQDYDGYNLSVYHYYVAEILRHITEQRHSVGGEKKAKELMLSLIGMAVILGDKDRENSALSKNLEKANEYLNEVKEKEIVMIELIMWQKMKIAGLAPHVARFQEADWDKILNNWGKGDYKI